MKVLKSIAALIFVSALGITLVQPVLRADDRERDGASPKKAGSGDSDGPGDIEKTLDESHLFAYAKRCLQETRASTTGLLVARRGSTASIGLPTGPPVARVEVDGDAAWSPSGLYVAESGGRVYDPAGNPEGSLFIGPVEWRWSPAADCALAVTEGGNLTFSIPGTKRLGIRLLDARATEFEISPNGRRLALVLEDEGLWIADLRRGAVVRVDRERAVLAGWFSNGKVVYSRYRSNGRLRFASGSGRRGVVRNGDASGALVRCGDRVLLSGSPRDSSPSLSELVARRGGLVRSVIVDGEGYWGASCSPDGGFIAASRARRNGERGPLVLLAADGAFVRTLASGRTANPTWTSQGIVYVKFGAARRGRLWFITPDATAPVPTEYRVGAPTQYDWHTRSG